MSKRQRGAEVSNQGEVARRGLVSVNRLDYTLQPDLSVAVARSSKKHFFQQSEYTPGQRAICILNSGAEYIDPQNSYLRFEVETVANADPALSSLNLGAGSACNFIKQLILTTRSGDEIERIEQVNQLAVQLDRYMNTNDWVNSQGEVVGYLNANETASAATNAATPTTLQSLSCYNGIWSKGGGAPVASTTISPCTGRMIPGFIGTVTESRTFVIPLSCISGLFKSFDRLIPSMLASGLRIEIEWEQATDVGMWPSGVTPSYKIKTPEIVMDQYQLTDSIMRVLNEEAALRGLEVVFSTWYNHDSAQGTNKSYNVQIRKAVSRALGVLSRISLLRGASQEKDNFLAYAADIVKYQVRVGALYFPQQGVANPDPNQNNVELYHHTLRGLGKWKTPQAPTSVNLTDYKGGGADTTQSFQSLYTDLERSNTQKLTGIPINNSRVAEIVIERLPAGAGNLATDTVRLNTYLHYVRLLRVFLQNVEVEE